MHTTNRLNKKGDIPGWVYIIGLIVGLIIVGFFLWVSLKSQQANIGILEAIGNAFRR